MCISVELILYSGEKTNKITSLLSQKGRENTKRDMDPFFFAPATPEPCGSINGGL